METVSWILAAIVAAVGIYILLVAVFPLVKEEKDKHEKFKYILFSALAVFFFAILVIAILSEDVYIYPWLDIVWISMSCLSIVLVVILDKL